MWIAAAVVLALRVPHAGQGPLRRSHPQLLHPGQRIPLALIGGIFLVKYFVGVELAMAPQLMRDTQYALTAGLRRAFTGASSAAPLAAPG